MLEYSAFSLCLALLGPLLVPSFSLSAHLISALFYDIETVSPLVSLAASLLWNILILGLLQPLVCCLVAAVFCPLLAGLITALALTRRALRLGWDTVIFHAVIKKRARVPAGDSFVAKRISGPGLASNYFYQIKTEQALVALEARMEMDEIEAYKVNISL